MNIDDIKYEYTYIYTTDIKCKDIDVSVSNTENLIYIHLIINIKGSFSSSDSFTATCSWEMMK